MYYLILVGATLLLAGNFVANKVYQSKCGTGIKTGLFFNLGISVIALILFLCLSKFKVAFTPFSFLMTAGVSICAMAYTIIGFRIMKKGNMAIYTLFLMSGGTVLPYLFGLIFLGEQVSVLRIIGIVLIILAIVLANISKEKLDFKMLLSCIAVFILNGVLGIFSSLNQKGADLYGFETIDSYSFIVYGNLVKIGVSLVALAVLFIAQKLRKNDTSEEKDDATANKKSDTLDKKTIVIIALTIVASAIFDGIGYLLQLTALPHLPASVQYPFLTGGSMIATTLAGIVFFRDKPKKMTLISIALCFVSLFLFLEF